MSMKLKNRELTVLRSPVSQNPVCLNNIALANEEIQANHFC